MNTYRQSEVYFLNNAMEHCIIPVSVTLPSLAQDYRAFIEIAFPIFFLEASYMLKYIVSSEFSEKLTKKIFKNFNFAIEGTKRN